MLERDYNSPEWRFTVGYVEVADRFNPEVGCVRRRGFRNLDSGFSYIYRPRGVLKLHQIRPHATFNRFWNFDGVQESSFLHIDNDLEFNDSTLIKTAWNITGEAVATRFEIAEGVVVPVGNNFVGFGGRVNDRVAGVGRAAAHGGRPWRPLCDQSDRRTAGRPTYATAYWARPTLDSLLSTTIRVD